MTDMGLILPKLSRRTLLKAGVGLFVPCAPAIIRPARAALTVNQLGGFDARQPADAPAGSNIQFVGGATASKLGATSGNSTIALNSGLTGGIASSASSGDFVIGVFGTGSLADRTLAITDGSTDYTLIGSELFITNSIGGTNFRVAYKFITGDTTITFGPTGSTSDAGTMAAYVFRGVNVSTPIDVTTTTATQASNSAANPPSITPATDGSYIVCAGSTGHVSGTLTFSSSDLTDFLTIGASDTNMVSLGIGHKPDWTSGPFDAAAFTHAGGSFGCWAAMSIALRTS
jgi:hypothetical protein